MWAYQNVRLLQHWHERAAEQTAEQHVARRLPRLVGSIPPYSVRAAGVGVVCFGIALLVQIAYRSIGGTLIFPTYFPAVLVAGLLAGLPAGLFVTIAALLTVWWGFLPPRFSFFPLTFNQQLDLAAFLISSGCILSVSECYRAALRQVRRQEQEHELIVKELEHRGRNTYALIDAIIQKTFEDQPERANIASGRIRAVKYANDLINQASTHTVLLKTVLLHEFVPYGEARVHAEGPDVELSPDVARHLVLAFHELVTNAVKYGALSKPGGRVLISWKCVEGVVRLEWREEGGPTVSRPKAHGFGSKLVTQTLKAISGSIAPTFGAEGLHCSITFRA